MSLLLFIIVLNFSKSDTNLEDKHFFNLIPSLDPNQPHYLYALTNQYLLTINATEGDNCKIIDRSDTNEYTYKDLSSTILINDSYLVKTCIGPNKLVEIVHEEEKYHYIKDLKNMKYCYSNQILNPSVNSQHKDKYVIITYFAEEIQSIQSSGKYAHKVIFFYPETNNFSEEEYTLKTASTFFLMDESYPENCITFREKDIYCYIHYKGSETLGVQLLVNNYVIETDKIIKREDSVFPVLGNTRISQDNYKRAVNLNRQENTMIINQLTRGTKDIYLTECHDRIDFLDLTMLRFSYYIGESHTNYIRTEETYGLKIENKNLNPNLLNYLSSNQNEMIILYINEKPKISLAISRIITSGIVYSYKGYTVNDYIRYDICAKPAYMQSLYIKSFINYNEKDKEYMKNHPTKIYYKYEKSIAVLISCKEETTSNTHQALKIETPQCLNELDEINGNNLHKLNFVGDGDEIEFDIYNDPNLVSFRNVSIIFNSSEIFVILISIKIKQEGDLTYSPLLLDKAYKHITHIKFRKNVGFFINTPLKVPYKVINKGSNENIGFNQMQSNICYLEITTSNNQQCKVNYCIICQNSHVCRICDTEMNSLILDKIETSDTYGQCICDESKGMQKSPEKYNMCICIDGYSFYNGIDICLKTEVLEILPTYVDDIEEKSKISIYRDCPYGCKKCVKDEQQVPKCYECIEGFFLKGNECSNKIEKCSSDIWFKIDNIYFNYVILGDCVFIFQENDLFLISSEEDCAPFMDNSYYEYITDCLNNQNVNLTKFLDIENAVSYNINSEGIIAEIYIEAEVPIDENNNIKTGRRLKSENTRHVIYHFHLLKFNNTKQTNDSLSSLELNNYNSDKDLLLFKVDIKRDDIISTQVVYQFYDSEPKKIYQKLDLKEENENIETILYLPMSLDENKMTKIKELPDSNIAFNSSDEFYLDVCYKFTNSKYDDVYLEDRKEYFISEPLCEEGCIFGNFEENNTKRIKCICDLKDNIYNSNDAKFKSNEKSEEFSKKYNAPNIKVLKCGSTVSKTLGTNLGFYFTFISLLIFTGYFIHFIITNKGKGELYQNLIKLKTKLVGEEHDEEDKKSQNHVEGGNSEIKGDEKSENQKENTNGQPSEGEINHDKMSEFIPQNQNLKRNIKNTPPSQDNNYKNDNNNNIGDDKGNNNSNNNNIIGNDYTDQSISVKKDLISNSNNDTDKKSDKGSEINSGNPFINNKQVKGDDISNNNKSNIIQNEESKNDINMILNDNKGKEGNLVGNQNQGGTSNEGDGDKDKDKDNNGVNENKGNPLINYDKNDSSQIINNQTKNGSINNIISEDTSSNINIKINIDIKNKINRVSKLDNEQDNSPMNRPSYSRDQSDFMLDNTHLNAETQSKNQENVKQNIDSEDIHIGINDNNINNNIIGAEVDNKDNLNNGFINIYGNNDNNNNINYNIDAGYPIFDDEANKEINSSFKNNDVQGSFATFAVQKDKKDQKYPANPPKPEIANSTEQFTKTKKIPPVSEPIGDINFLDKEEYDKLQKEKSDNRNILQMFNSILKSNNSFYFVFLDKCKDFEIKFIKVSLLIIPISLYLFIHTLLLYNRAMVKLYSSSFNFGNFVLNIFLSLLISPIMIVIKKYLTLRDFIQKIIEKLLSMQKEDKSTTEINTELLDMINKQDKYKNKEIYKNIIIFGSISTGFLIFNCVLVTHYCGIYPNSVWRLVLNTFISFIITSIIYLLFYLIGAFLRFKSLEKNSEIMYNISRFFNISNLSLDDITKMKGSFLSIFQKHQRENLHDLPANPDDNNN